MKTPKEIYILKTKAPDGGLGIAYHLHPIETEKITSVKYIRADIAEHFFNLALEEVRKEVKIKYDCIDDIVIDWDDGYETACREILNFIDNLTK